jgi:hypothetical protein
MKYSPLFVVLVLSLVVALPAGAAPRLPAAPTICNPLAGTWADITYGLTPATRNVGVWYPVNGRFYSLGGRTADGIGNDIVNPQEYDPAANTWVAKTAAFGDLQVDNMVAGVVDFGSGPLIVAVGGSAGGQTTATAEVRVYDPVLDTLSVLAADAWPGGVAGDTLPGGAAVYNNKLYVFGGFQINVAMDNRVWEFDPMAASGSRWTLKTATLPVALGYIPTATVGSYIYLAGGSEYVAAVPTNTTGLYRYDPVADSFTTLASMTAETSNTKAVSMFGEQLWVLAGAFGTSISSVQVYDPATDSWVAGPDSGYARRNFAVDIDPATGKIYAYGGYYPSGTEPTDVAQAFTACVPTSVTVSNVQATSGSYGLWVLAAVVGLAVVAFALFRRARA